MRLFGFVIMREKEFIKRDAATAERSFEDGQFCMLLKTGWSVVNDSMRIDRVFEVMRTDWYHPSTYRAGEVVHPETNRNGLFWRYK